MIEDDVYFAHIKLDNVALLSVHSLGRKLAREQELTN
jgi:hypothetical protein